MSTKIIKALIIDDEPLAHKVIKNYAQDIPYLELVGNAYDAFEAQQLLQEKEVDLIFLDIHLPKIKGLKFLKTLVNPPLVIVASAYDNYAIQGYELNICDYLLKPYDFERFLKAVNKVMGLKTGNSDSSQPQHSLDSDKSSKQIFVKNGKKHLQINYKDILYLEAYGSYTKIHLIDKMILASERISSFEENLTDGFVRIHKSYMVAIEHIKILEGSRLTVGTQELPIGNIYKLQVKRLLLEK